MVKTSSWQGVYDDERQQLILKRRRLLSKLKDALETGSMPMDELDTLTRKITQLNVQLARIPKRELEGLKQVFTPRERARYLLFSQKFSRQARMLIGRHRGTGARRRDKANALATPSKRHLYGGTGKPLSCCKQQGKA